MALLRAFLLLRRLVSMLTVVVCGLLIINTFFLEAFHVPTGSMAPTLLGHHRSLLCPTCGFAVAVGASPRPRDLQGEISCPNCGQAELSVTHVAQAVGDHVLVNKFIYALRRPRRWEVIVFRMFGKTFIKRLIGLGGEEIEIVEGDIYVDGKLVRKTFAEFMGMRVLAYDNDFVPPSSQRRWAFEPSCDGSVNSGCTLDLDGRTHRCQAAYRHFCSADGKWLPLLNEYAYNGSDVRETEAVHDFMVEADVVTMEGTGALGFSLFDGGTDVEVVLDVGKGGEVTVISNPPGVICLGETARLPLAKGQRFHVEMALVDRRLTFRVDGRDVFEPADLPDIGQRQPVVQPLRLFAEGMLAKFEHVRLFRDVHYAQMGKNGVHGRTVPLPINQTFVLGDNSTNSEDSRYWPADGAVPLDSIVGRAFFVHLPSRAVSYKAWGRECLFQVPDWQRVRSMR